MLPRRPFVESLEPRQLFAAAAATHKAPDLAVALTYSPPAYVQPGTNISTTLLITNIGGPIPASTKVPVRFFLSPTPTLAPGAVPFDIVQKKIQLTAHQTRAINFTTTLPATTNSHPYYLIIDVDHTKAVKETNLTNNVVVTPALVNPLGTYTGTYTSDDHHPGTITMRFSAEAATSSTTKGSLFADVTINSPGLHFSRTHIKARISPIGKGFLIVPLTQGSFYDPSAGHVTYKFSFFGPLTGKTISSNFHLIYRTPTTSRNFLATSTLTRTKA